MKNNKYYPWFVVSLLWVVALLNYLDRQMLSTMRPSMMIDIEELISATNFGRLMSIFLWIYAFMSPVSGMIADRLNRKWLIVGSLFVWSGVTLMMGYAQTFEQLYALRALMGISEAFYIPAALALIADYHQDKTRSLAIGIHTTGIYLGQALGGFGATIASNFSWQVTFHWFGIAGIAYSIILILFLREKKTYVIKSNTIDNKPPVSENIRNSLKGIGMLIGNIAFWVILFYFSASSVPGWAVKNWLPTLFSESLHMDMSHAGPLSTILIAAASFIGVLIGGVLSDKWVLKNLKGRVYTSVIGLSLTIPALFLIGFGTDIISFIMGAVCFGVGYGMFDTNNMPILCQFISSRYRATAYGVMNLAGVSAGAFITDILGKSMDNGSLGRDFAMLALVIVFAVILQLTILRPKTIDKKED
ncbi:MAG: MFS transporter [Paludibacter sp.]|nr:MFS transporter [Paludibacter sp.]